MIQLNLRPLIFVFSLALIISLSACHQQSSSHYFKNGSAKYELKNYNGAILDLNKAIELDSVSAYAYYLRALSYSNLNKTEQASTDFNRAIRLDPKFKDAYFNRAYYIHQQNGEYKKAIEDYNTFIGLKPSKYVAFALNNRGWSEYKLGMLDKALEDINSSIRKNAENPLAYKNKAVIYFSMDSLDAACDFYQKAVQLGFSSHEKDAILDSLYLNCR